MIRHKPFRTGYSEKTFHWDGIRPLFACKRNLRQINTLCRYGMECAINNGLKRHEKQPFMTGKRRFLLRKRPLITHQSAVFYDIKTHKTHKNRRNYTQTTVLKCRRTCCLTPLRRKNDYDILKAKRRRQELYEYKVRLPCAV